MFILWILNVALLISTLLSDTVNLTRIPRQAGSCTTPDNEPGNCIEVRSCPRLYDLILTQNQDKATVDFLRKSQCGYEGRYPKVCCSLRTAGSVTPTTPSTSVSTSKVGALSSFQCGKSNSTRIRIVGGQPSELGAWPWIAALGYRTSIRPGPDFRCGGTLITDRHVITASHCVVNVGSYILSVIRLGDLNLDDKISDGASPIDIPVAKITPHSEYVAKPVSNDIAIITLQTPVQFNRLIQPVCLPATPQLRSDVFAKRMPYIIGWGATAWQCDPCGEFDIEKGAPSSNDLQEAQVPTVDNDKCKQNYANEKNAVIDDRVICAGGGGKDTCQGDSGGPLILPNGTTFYLIGVVSYGVRCAEPNYPGVYTRITHFMDWIEANTR